MSYLNSILIVGQIKDLFPDNPNKIIIEPEAVTIGIEQIRQLKKALIIRPTNNQPLVAIISQAEKLTEEAQNALLKTLEEPPENVFIVLCTPDEDLLLPTVVSRCQVISNLSNLSGLGNLSDLKKVLLWMEQGSIKEGFAWAAGKDRQEGLKIIDQLLTLKPYRQARKLLAAKKQLLANTNVRLALENLFLNC